MIIDAHYHLEEQMQTVPQLLEQMDRHGISRVALIPVIGAPFPWTSVTEKASALMRVALTRHWRAGMKFYNDTVTEKGEFSLLGKIFPIYPVPRNEPVAQALQAHPDRFWGWILVNPSAADPLAEMEKWVTKPGWIGVKSHPFWHRYPVARLDDVAAVCAENSLPLLVHLGGTAERGDFRYLPQRHPKLRIVYAHAGVPFYRELWDYAQDKPNIYVDLSSTSYVSAGIRRGAIKALGAHRCLAGTDGPYCNADHGQMIQDIRRLPIGESEQECILGGNFAELVGR